jgi:carboxylesterase
VRPALCVHGLSGAAEDLDDLAAGLGGAGYAGVTPCLPGHDGSLPWLMRARLQDWRDEVRREARHLSSETGEPLLVVGLSMGALLGLELATSGEIPIAGVASLAAPLTLGPAARAAAALGRTELGQRFAWPKRGGPDVERRVEVPNTPGLPLGAIADLQALADLCRDRIAALTAPLLVIHAAHDHAAPWEGSIALFGRSGARWRRLVVLDRGFHLVTRDHARDRVTAEVVRFAQLLA